MSDDITQRLRAAVPKMPDSGTPIAWPCEVRSELLLEAAAEVEKLRAALRDIERGDYSDPMCERTPEQRAREALEAKP